ncbi:MAG: DUF2206 domain-containing protein [Chloroflexi bacterium]|nr:DUF2206 domain-containing protein [Chloroflexota bacterium]
MPEITKRSSLIWFAGIIAIIAATNLAIFFDVPILRQLLALVFLIVVPGLLLLFLSKLNHLPTAEKLVLTIGLSIAFVMLFGWGLNQASITFGYMAPLTPRFLTVSLSLVFVVLAIAAYLTNRTAFSLDSFRLELNTRSKLCLILPSFFPLLAILGTRLINTSGNNIVLMVLLFLVPVAFTLIILQRQKISADTYPLAIVLTAVTLLSIFWLRSEHVLGHDVHLEYYFFQTTFLDQYWSVFEYSTLNSTLSISLLPAVFQSLLNLPAQEQLFKGLFVIICSFTPLVVYIIAQKYLGEINAFLAALFVAFGSYYLLVPGSPRTSVAIFFFAVCVMVLFHSGLPMAKRSILFITFMLATITSHYSTTYIFFFMLLFVAAAAILLRKNMPSRRLSMMSVGLFFVLIFSWYSQLTEAPFASGVSFISRTIRNLSKFFVAETRSTEALTVLGSGNLPQSGTYLSWVHFVITWSTFIVIGVGVIGVLVKWRTTLLHSRQESAVLPPLKEKIEIEFLLLAVAACGLLAAMLVLPFVSIGYEIQRGFGQAAIVLSTFFILGSVFLAQRWLRNPHMLTMLILIPYFLFNSGALYELSGIHDKNWLLSLESPIYRYEFVHEQETTAIKWLGERMETEGTVYVIDSPARDKMVSQWARPGRSPVDFRYFSRGGQSMPNDSYLFLSYNNVVGNQFITQGNFFSMDKYTEVMTNLNKLFSNGGSEIYR